MSAVDSSAPDPTLTGRPATPVTDAAASPFTMVAGDPSAMVCEGDVCFVPGEAAAD